MMDYLDTLLERGATNKSEVNVSDFVNDDSEFYEELPFHDLPMFTNYGRGWLLKANDTFTYKRYGKYFEGGFWMPTLNGWFFKTNDKNALLQRSRA